MLNKDHIHLLRIISYPISSIKKSICNLWRTWQYLSIMVQYLASKHRKILSLYLSKVIYNKKISLVMTVAMSSLVEKIYHKQFLIRHGHSLYQKRPCIQINNQILASKHKVWFIKTKINQMEACNTSCHRSQTKRKHKSNRCLKIRNQKRMLE